MQTPAVNRGDLQRTFRTGSSVPQDLIHRRPRRCSDRWPAPRPLLPGPVRKRLSADFPPFGVRWRSAARRRCCSARSTAAAAAPPPRGHRAHGELIVGRVGGRDGSDEPDRSGRRVGNPVATDQPLRHGGVEGPRRSNLHGPERPEPLPRRRSRTCVTTAVPLGCARRARAGCCPSHVDASAARSDARAGRPRRPRG